MNVSTKGLTEFIDKLDALEKNAQKLMKEALYDGADLLANEIKKGLEALPVYQTKNGKPVWGTPERKLRGVTQTQKDDIIRSFGISHHIAKDGNVYAYIGINGRGYTEGYWRGTNEVPIAVLLRTLESGNSFTEKIPTIRPAINRAKKPALSAMQKSFEGAIKKYSR